MITNDEQIVTITRGEITDLLARFAQAQRLPDVDELSGLLTDDFKLVGPRGFVVPKEAQSAGSRRRLPTQGSQPTASSE
jgi:hypothetical protein